MFGSFTLAPYLATFLVFNVGLAQGDLKLMYLYGGIATLGTLTALRASQGHSVAVVDIEDVYDEFSFGQKTPQALRDFLQWARTNWRTPPRFVVLAGDATTDLRASVHAVPFAEGYGAQSAASSLRIRSQGGIRASGGADGSNSTRTPMPRSVSRLAPNAGWLASWGLQCGTITTGTP